MFLQNKRKSAALNRAHLISGYTIMAASCSVKNAMSDQRIPVEMMVISE
jgi:hypothetical protein